MGHPDLRVVASQHVHVRCAGASAGNSLESQTLSWARVGAASSTSQPRSLHTVEPVLIESPWAGKRVSTGALAALDDPSGPNEHLIERLSSCR